MVSSLTRTIAYNWGPFVWPGVLSLLGLGFALIPLARGEFFFYWDNARQHFAQTAFLHDALRSGQIPHWWPHVGFGLPTVAEGQAAHFHPIRLMLAFLFTPSVAFMTEIGLWLVVAGLSTYFFLREFRLLRAACFVGGLCQMFGSFSVVFIRNVALHRAFCLLPLAMFLAERFVTRQKFSYALAMSLVLGLQLLSGHPTFAMITIVATSIYILTRILQRSWQRNESLRVLVRQLLAPTLLWGLAVALGFTIAGIQVVPQLLHTEHSIRQGGLKFEYAVVEQLAAKVRYLPQLFFPYVYVQGDWLKTPTQSGSYLNLVPLGGIYLGALPILFALLSLWWYRRRLDPAWPLAVCFLIATGFALGDRTPLYPSLWSLPGMNGMRFPHRFLLWSSFCLACLAGLGLQRVLTYSRLRRWQIRDLIPFLFIGGLIFLLGLFFWTQEKPLAAMIPMAQDFRTGIVISIALFVAGLGLIWSLLTVGRPYQRFLIALVILLVFGDIWIFRLRSGYAPAFPIKEALTAPEVVELLRSDPDHFRVMSLIPDHQGLNRNQDLLEFLQADIPAIWGIRSADDHSSLMLKRYYAVHEGILWELLNSPEAGEKLAGFLGTLNVKYVVAPNSVTLLGWKRVYQSDRAATWKNPAFLPSAFLVGNILPENIEVHEHRFDGSVKRLDRYYRMVSNWGTRIEDAQIIDNILSHPIDYRKTALVAGPELPKLNGVNAKSEVRSGPQETDRMSFEVNSNSPALLVISNNYYPGWSATVNGQPTKILRTNYTSMGVSVPQGRSEVVLDFVTPGFRLGAVISVISICLCAVGLFAPQMRKMSWAMSSNRKMRPVPARNA